MTLHAPIAMETVALAAAVLAGLAALAYILKMRRRRFEVPFSTLWQRVLQEKESTSLWKHLRRLLSLLLQLCILGMLLLAVLDPRLGSPDADARSVVVIIDASASMKAMDESPDGDGDGATSRMEVARDEARDLLAAMGGGDMAMIMRMDGQTTPLSRFDSDMAMLTRTVTGIQASDTPADLRRALGAAADALRDRENPLIVLIGDGAYPEEVLDSVVWQAPQAGEPAGGQADQAEPAANLAAIDLGGIDVRFVPVGQQSENVGIVAFNARRYLTDKTSYAAFIEVQNFGSAPARRKLVVYSGDSAVDVKTVTIAPGERLREMYPNLAGGEDSRLRAQLQPLAPENDDGDGGTGTADVFPLDDEAFALLPARKKQKVLLVTTDNLYLEGAMLVYDSIQVDKLTPDEYDQAMEAGTLDTYDAVVLDEHAPARLPEPPTNLIYFGPSGEHSPFPIRRTVEYPRVTEVETNHPIMRWVLLSDVNFDETSVFAVDRARGEVALASYVREPMIAARREDGRKVVAFGFRLSGTDLPLRVAFPLLLVNTLDWFAGGSADLITTYRTGRRFRVPMDGVTGVSEVDVTTPGGRHTRAPVTDGQATFYGHSIGVHRLAAQKDGQVVAALELAANLANPAESNIAPRDRLTLGGVVLEEPAGFHATRRQSLWMYLALAAALLLCVEWLTYHRRITV